MPGIRPPLGHPEDDSGQRGAPSFSRPTPPRAEPRLGPFSPIIHAILEADRTAPPEQRHTAERLFRRVREGHGYAGCVSIVRAAVRDWKQTRAEVFVPPSQPPGKAQVDFGHAEVVVAGEPATAAFFVMTLPYSDAFFCLGFRRSAPRRSRRGTSGRLRISAGCRPGSATTTRRLPSPRSWGSGGAKPTREFLRLASHFLLEHQFYRVRRPSEKGHVEVMVGFARRNFLVPVPATDSREALNEVVAGRCRADLTRHLRGQPRPKAQLLDEERPTLRALPAQAFEARRVELGQSNSLSLVRFDGNDYSVPTALAHRAITIVGGLDEVRLVCRDQLVARHRLHWGRSTSPSTRSTTWPSWSASRGRSTTPGRWSSGHLPDEFGVLRRRPEAAWGPAGIRHFIKVLRLLEKCSLGELTAAVEAALAIGANMADAVRVLLEQRREVPVTLFRLDGRPHLAE